MYTFAHWVFSDMELDRKFEIATSCRSVSLGSLEPDQRYPFVQSERINTRYGRLRFANHLREGFSVKTMWRRGVGG